MSTETEESRLRIAVRELNRLGLYVYGPCVDIDTGYTEGGNMDFDPDQVIAWRRFKAKHPSAPFEVDEN